MFGWFQPKSPLTDDRRDWIDWRFEWLRREFGDEPLRRPLVMPTREFFPDPYAATRDDVETVFQRVCKYMHIDRSRLSLNFYQRGSIRPGSRIDPMVAYEAAGLYMKDDAGDIAIWLEESRLDLVESGISTLAHELAHVHLLADGHIRADDPDDDHEFLTDLAAVFFGLGIFTANSTRRDESGYIGGWSWSSVQTMGYLQMYELAYALAVYAKARGETSPAWIKHLRADVRGDFKSEMSNLVSGKRALFTDQLASAKKPFEENRPRLILPEIDDDSLESEQVEEANLREDDGNDDESSGKCEGESPADELFTLGVIHANAGEYELAVAAFSQALELEPNDFEVMLNRAESSLVLGNLEQAIADSSRCIGDQDFSLAGYHCRGRAYLKMSRFEDALQDFNAAFELSEFELKYFYRGLAQLGLGNHQKAIRDFTTALVKAPNYIDIYLARSHAYERAGDQKRAQADIADAIRRDGELIDAKARAQSLAKWISRDHPEP